MCEICKGTKHIRVIRNGRPVLIRCECLLLEELEHKLQQFNLTIQPITDLIVKGKVSLTSKSYEVQLAKKILEAIKENRPTKKPVVCLTSRSQQMVTRLLTILIACLNQQEIQYVDISDIVSSVFSNSKVVLNKLNILTTYFDTTKSVSSKLIQELYNKARMENKVVILVTKDTLSLKDLEIFQNLNDVFLFPSSK